MSSQLDKLLIGLSGEYLVCGMMNLKGWVASLTLKNYPGVDIFALNPKNDSTKNIQVKTIRNKSADFPIGLRHSNIAKIHDVIKSNYVFVHIKDEQNIDYYIISKNELINLIKTIDDSYFNRPRTKPLTDYPISIKAKYLQEFKNKWDNIWI
jgi:hypothetical protein